MFGRRIEERVNGNPQLDLDNRIDMYLWLHSEQRI